jgi:hypothetical protein
VYDAGARVPLNAVARSKTMPVTRIPVDVIMQRVPLSNRWASEKWEPAEVVVTGEPQQNVEWTPGAPQLVQRGEDGERWRFPGCSVELHHTEAEGYFLNLSAPHPHVFVMWRRFDDGREPIAQPVVVTLSYNEAARMMDGGEQVDPVPMCGRLHAWLAPFVAEHYKPEPRKKARRNDPFATEGDRDPAFDAGKIRRS